MAVAAAALGAGAVVAVYHPTSNASSAAPAPSITVVPSAPAAQPSSPALTPNAGSGSGTTAGEAAVLKKVEPGLVLINTTLQYSSEEAAGTGMVIKPNGLILTNNHVIENATKISATVLATGRTYPAKIVGYDVTSDVAEIQLQGASGLHTIPIGNSSTVKSGTSVVAMGNAEGQNQIVPAAGKITGIDQTITASDEGGTVSSETLHDMLATNADIVSGDSGGPLATTAGEVIGMDTAGNSVSYPQQQSTSGFAIPINRALAIGNEISSGQASSTVVIGYPPFIGIYIGKGTSASPQTQASQEEQGENGGAGSGGGFGGGFGGSGSGSGGTPSCYTNDSDLTAPSTIASVKSGTLVLGTICGSPAATAGLTAGSVITSVEGQTIGSPDSLTTIMSKYKPGAHVSLTWVTPSNQTKTGTLSLTAGPPL